MPQAKEENTATFLSKDRGYKIWLKGPNVTIYPTGARVIQQGSGASVDFLEHHYQTNDRKIIAFLMKPENGFETKYWPDPLDPTGYWMKKGYFKEEMVKTRVPVNLNAAIEEEGKKANLAVAEGFAKQAIRDSVKTESLRTSRK